MPPDSIIVRTTEDLTANIPSEIAARSAVLNDLWHVGDELVGVHRLACSDRTVQDWLACVRALQPQEVSQSSDHGREQSISLLTRYLQVRFAACCAANYVDISLVECGIVVCCAGSGLFRGHGIPDNSVGGTTIQTSEFACCAT